MADPQLSAALLSWVQTFPLDPPVRALSDLSDGHLLYQILQDIDYDYFIDPLPSSEAETSNNWIPRWQNLKYIDRVVRAYVRDVCGVLDSSTENTSEGPLNADLKAVAQKDGQKSEKDTVVLLKGILRAAMYSPQSNQRMGRVVVGLGPEAAKAIATTLAAMEDSGAKEDEEQVEEQENSETHISKPAIEQSKIRERSDTSAGARDVGLEDEEKLIQAHRIIRQLEESNAKAASELEDLRKDKDSLEQAFESFRYEAENSGQKRIEDVAMRELRARADRDRDYITEVESELENVRNTMQSQERQIERFKSDTDAKQKLRDDLQVITAERDDLVNKSRANENLRKKIQTMQDQEKQNTTLREDLHSAQEQLQTLESMKQQCERLRKANEENMNIIANTEQEIFDQKTSRKRLEHEFKVLQQKWELARERQTRDHETITDLEEKLQKLDATGATPAREGGGLEQELSSANNRRPSNTRQLSVSVPSADLALIEEKLRAITVRNSKLETDYLDILQDKLGLETALADLRDPEKEPEENVPFLEQRKKLSAAQSELAKLQDSMFATTAELASVKEKVLAMQDGTLQNGAAKEANLDSNAEYQALSSSYAELTRHSEDVESDLAEHKSLLRHALLSHAAVLKEPEEVRKMAEYEIVRRQLEEVRTAEDDGIVLDVAGHLADKIDAARGEVGEVKTLLAAKDEKIASLESQLSQAAKEPAKLSQSDEKMLANMRRENQLIQSAWYGLTGRLQSNAVMVGKRAEPKSFLGKQRAIVGLGTGTR